MQTIEQVAEFINAKEMGRPLVVFICGFGGAGKTTFCHNLAGLLSRPSVVFETDWYARYATTERKERIKSALALQDDELIELEEDPKNWYDWKALTAGLQQLKTAGRLDLRNAWCQKTGEKQLSIELMLPDPLKSVIICDGIYLLHEGIRHAADICIRLNVDLDACLERGRKRDAHRSTPEYLDYKAALTRQYDEPYFERYGANADVVVNV
jgi:uridine kinase